MPNTKITKQKFKDHFSYAKKVYIFGALIAVAAASLIFTVTRYTPDNEYSVVVALVDSYANVTNL